MDHDGTQLNEIVLPLMNVSRPMATGKINPREINQQRIFMTSAGTKSSHAYEELVGTLQTAIIKPKDAFVMGFDYRIPVKHGLLARNFIDDLRLSPSYNEASFATEYLSLWRGSSEESWFDYSRLLRHRKLKNPDFKAKKLLDNQFYLLSMDVGRYNDQTVVTVFRVTKGLHKYTSAVTNIYVLGILPEDRTFHRQTIDLKHLIKKYNPLEVVIDTNGIGAAIADNMIQSQIDEKTGETMIAYGFKNDKNYEKTQYTYAPRILYGIKATSTLNSQIHSNAYSRISSGLVRFLISEQDARSYLLSTKKGQKMTPQQRIERLMPHEMTTKLHEEMGNLRLRQTGISQNIVLEKINSRFPKDKYSSFSYGLWRIKELEEEGQIRSRRAEVRDRDLIFFTR